ncbi:hypothetical protein V8E53_014733 [Lactarius tabidus]
MAESKTLQDTLWFELLVQKCMGAFEENLSTSSARMNHMNKLLKDLRRRDESSRCGQNFEDIDAEALVAKFKLAMENGDRLLKGVLSNKPSHESPGDYLDRLASRHTAPKHQSTQPEGSLFRRRTGIASAGQATVRQSPTPSPSILGSVLGSPSSITASHFANHNIAESSTSGGTPTEEAPVFLDPFSSLFHEIHRASRVQTPPSPTRSRSLPASSLSRMELPARSRSLSASSLSQIELPTNKSPPPLQRLASDVSLILDVSLTFNQSLEVLSVVQNEETTVLLQSDPTVGSSRTPNSAHPPAQMRDPETEPIKYLVYKRMATLLTFKLLSSWRQSVEVGNIYLQMWSDWGSMHAGMVLGRILVIHPSLAQVVPLVISFLLSLHPATLLYACLLYIHEAVVMATEMDPELTIA